MDLMRSLTIDLPASQTQSHYNSKGSVLMTQVKPKTALIRPKIVTIHTPYNEKVSPSEYKLTHKHHKSTVPSNRIVRKSTNVELLLKKDASLFYKRAQTASGTKRVWGNTNIKEMQEISNSVLLDYGCNLVPRTEPREHYYERRAMVDLLRRSWRNEHGYCSILDKRKLYKSSNGLNVSSNNISHHFNNDRKRNRRRQNQTEFEQDKLISYVSKGRTHLLSLAGKLKEQLLACISKGTAGRINQRNCTVINSKTNWKLNNSFNKRSHKEKMNNQAEYFKIGKMPIHQTIAGKAEKRYQFLTISDNNKQESFSPKSRNKKAKVSIYLATYDGKQLKFRGSPKFASESIE